MNGPLPSFKSTARRLQSASGPATFYQAVTASFPPNRSAPRSSEITGASSFERCARARTTSRLKRRLCERTDTTVRRKRRGRQSFPSDGRHNQGQRATGSSRQRHFCPASRYSKPFGLGQLKQSGDHPEKDQKRGRLRASTHQSSPRVRSQGRVFAPALPCKTLLTGSRVAPTLNPFTILGLFPAGMPVAANCGVLDGARDHPKSENRTSLHSLDIEKSASALWPEVCGIPSPSLSPLIRG